MDASGCYDYHMPHQAVVRRSTSGCLPPPALYMFLYKDVHCEAARQTHAHIYIYVCICYICRIIEGERNPGFYGTYFCYYVDSHIFRKIQETITLDWLAHDSIKIAPKKKQCSKLFLESNQSNQRFSNSFSSNSFSTKMESMVVPNGFSFNWVLTAIPGRPFH